MCAAPTRSHITRCCLQLCKQRGIAGNCLQSKRDETEAAQKQQQQNQPCVCGCTSGVLPLRSARMQSCAVGVNLGLVALLLPAQYLCPHEGTLAE